ncbi:MAG: hypothetical protein Q8L57_02900 [bacterium]|nr:hypothetical protein [bacterium]
MRNKIYFGRPINVYGTELEKRILEKIAATFPEFEIENPGEERHKEEYLRWKQETGSGMDYFFKKVLPGCNAGVFLPFRDGAWGAGVFGEAEVLTNQGCPIYQITAEGVITWVNLDKIRVLTIEETISRIRTKTGETVPY